MSEQRPLLFALGASRPLGAAVAGGLGRVLSELEEREFEDGEHKARPLDPVLGRDVYVLHSLYGDAAQSVNDKLCRLLFFIAALGDAGAQRVTALIPYLPYARKDRRTNPQDPVTSRYVASLLEAVGVARVVTVEVHNPAAFENAFRCPTFHLQAAEPFAARLQGLLAGAPAVVISPDAGGMKRAELFRRVLEAQLQAEVGLGLVEKHRHGGVISGAGFMGEVDGRIAVIVDDLVSSGSTLVRAARACRERGAQRVVAVTTHALFSAGAAAALADPALDRLLVTDSVARPLPAGLQGKVEVLSVAPLLAEAVGRLCAGAERVLSL